MEFVPEPFKTVNVSILLGLRIVLFPPVEVVTIRITIIAIAKKTAGMIINNLLNFSFGANMFIVLQYGHLR